MGRLRSSAYEEGAAAAVVLVESSPRVNLEPAGLPAAGGDEPVLDVIFDIQHHLCNFVFERVPLLRP
jgi:hypothetical protein